MNKSFAVFILSHGRPNSVHTYNSLKRQGYGGDIYIICDDEDKTVNEYKSNFENVIVFCKQEYLDKSDVFDNSNEPRSIVLPARNFCFDLAKKLGLEYFWELDDDYTSFQIKGIRNGFFHDFSIKNLDVVCEKYIDFLASNEHIMTICFAQSGDYIGGMQSDMYVKKVKYKAMNSFFCKTSRPFKFYGRLNEDLTMSVIEGGRGRLVMTIGDAFVHQIETQQNKGGLTDAYLDMGTYRKSFYSVMACPSAVKISVMGDGYSRLHHNVTWNKVHPYILNERYKKR